MTTQEVNELRQYAEFIRVFRRSLQTLDLDLRLVEDEGWKYHFAVDFSELFAFAFPLSSRRRLHLQPIPNEQLLDTFSRELVTLTMILTRWNRRVLTNSSSLILLPPYIEEWQTWISIRKRELFELMSLMDIAVQIRNKTLHSLEPDFESLRSAVERYSEHSVPLSSDTQHSIGKFIEDAYQDSVSLVVACSGKASLRKLGDLLRDGSLVPIVQYFRTVFKDPGFNWKEFDASLEKKAVNKDSVSFAKALEKQPGRKILDMSNRIDAVACAMIERVNQQLTEHKHVMLMFTHSQAFANVARPIRLQDSRIAPSLHATRDLNYFWAYYVHQAKNMTTTRKRVSEILEMLDFYTSKFLWIGDERGIGKDEIDEAAYTLRELRTRLDEYANLSFGSSADEKLRTFLRDLGSGTIDDFADDIQEVNSILSTTNDRDLINYLVRQRNSVSRGLVSLALMERQLRDTKSAS